jgi:Zn-dependent peptidase ImmA (M78 family)
VRFLARAGEGHLSAATVFRAGRRLVVYNDSHPLPRQASDLCHEAAHALLLHEPMPAMDEHGCRLWNTEIEEEADYLGGALLILGKGARYYAKAEWSFTAIAARFECSEEMARWRNNASGGQRIRRPK